MNEKLYRPRHIWNYCRSCLDRVSTDYRPTIGRRIDQLSTEFRPTVDRVSTEYRPTVDRVSSGVSIAISTDISVDITHSTQDPKRLQKPKLGCLFEPSIRKRFNVFETVSSVHFHLQFQLCSVREVFNDLNVMSLLADRVKCEPESIKGSYEGTRECIR